MQCQGKCFLKRSATGTLIYLLTSNYPRQSTMKDAHPRQHQVHSQEIRDIIPVPLRRVRTTRSSTHSHPFQISLPPSRNLSHKSSFIPRTCNFWDVLPSSYIPESCNLPSFKTKIDNLDLIFLSPLSFLLLPMLGLYSHNSLSST